MPTWAIKASMPKVRASSGTMGTMSFPMVGCLRSLARIRTKAMVVEMARPPEPA